MEVSSQTYLRKLQENLVPWLQKCEKKVSANESFLSCLKCYPDIIQYADLVYQGKMQLIWMANNIQEENYIVLPVMTWWKQLWKKILELAEYAKINNEEYLDTDGIANAIVFQIESCLPAPFTTRTFSEAKRTHQADLIECPQLEPFLTYRFAMWNIQQNHYKREKDRKEAGIEKQNLLETIIQGIAEIHEDIKKHFVINEELLNDLKNEGIEKVDHKKMLETLQSIHNKINEYA